MPYRLDIKNKKKWYNKSVTKSDYWNDCTNRKHTHTHTDPQIVDNKVVSITPCSYMTFAIRGFDARLYL